MKILNTVLLMIIFTTSCMAQTEITDNLDCSAITVSPQLDDCVRKQMLNSNAVLSKEFEDFKKRVRQVYTADLKLGKELIKKVQKAQNAWITFRGLNCSVDAFEVEEGTAAYITTINNCTIRMNAERIKVLKKLLQ